MRTTFPHSASSSAMAASASASSAVAGLAAASARATAFFVPGTLVRNPLFFLYATTAEHCAHNVWDTGAPVTAGMVECLARVRGKVENDLLPLMAASALLWLPVNTLTFWVVPPNLRYGLIIYVEEKEGKILKNDNTDKLGFASSLFV